MWINVNMWMQMNIGWICVYVNECVCVKKTEIDICCEEISKYEACVNELMKSCVCL
jgi:hypothetical protein